MKGWLKFFREMLDHPVWSLPPGQTRVWLTILAMANIKPSRWNDGREEVDLQAGEFVTSQPHLADRAHVSRIVVRHALKNLERMGSIRAKGQAKRWTRIEVVNWGTYQGSEDEVSQETSPRRAKGEPRVSHRRRMEEGEKEKNVLSSGSSWAEYLATFSLQDQALLGEVAEAIASTRRTDKVAPSVLDAQARRWAPFPQEIVLQACRVYLDRQYAAEGKSEAYLTGIIRQEAKRAGQGRGNRHDPSASPKTAGQLAIDRVLAEMQREAGTS